MDQEDLGAIESRLSSEQRDQVEGLRREIETLRPEKRWLVVRSYMTEQSCELDAETAEEALQIARERFGWLKLEAAGPGCGTDIERMGDAVYDQHLEGHEAVLEAD